jgi:hypothetical protein
MFMGLTLTDPGPDRGGGGSLLGRAERALAQQFRISEERIPRPDHPDPGHRQAGRGGDQPRARLLDARRSAASSTIIFRSWSGRPAPAPAGEEFDRLVKPAQMTRPDR